MRLQLKHKKQMFKKTLIAGSLALPLLSATSQAGVVVLDFENINSTYPSGFANILEYYNGGVSSDGTTGTNYGISFAANAQAICLNTVGTSCSNTSRGGLGNPNSQLGGLFFLSGAATTMNVSGGFDTGFSFFYTAPNSPGAVRVYDGLNGTGNVLATLNLATTASTCTGLGTFCPFVAAGANFAGTALSVDWAGVANQVVFDDVTFGSSTPDPMPIPGTMAMLGLGLAGLASVRRRRSK